VKNEKFAIKRGVGFSQPAPRGFRDYPSTAAAADITAAWIDIAATRINDITATGPGLGLLALARVFFAFIGMFITFHISTSLDAGTHDLGLLLHAGIKPRAFASVTGP